MASARDPACSGKHEKPAPGKSSMRARFALLSRGKRQCPPFCAPRSISSWALGLTRARFSVAVLAALSSVPLSEGQRLPAAEPQAHFCWAPTACLGQLSHPWGRRLSPGGQLRCWGHWEQPSPRLLACSQWSRSSVPSETCTQTPGRVPLAELCCFTGAQSSDSFIQVPPRLLRRIIS